MVARAVVLAAKPEQSEVFMRRVMLIGLAALAWGALAACGDAGNGRTGDVASTDSQDSARGFLLDENSDTVLRGRLLTGEGQVWFNVTQAGGLASLTVRVNGKIFDTYRTKDSIIHDGYGAVLTAADHVLLIDLVEHLGARFAGAELPARVESIVSLTAFLSRAPIGYEHVRVVVADEAPVAALAPAAALGNEGVTCITKGTTRNAEYTDASLRAYSTPVVVGSNWLTCRDPNKNTGNYSCMGGCGAGCDSYGRARYTKDCLDHDTCSHEFCSTTGSSDPNCKDEYSAASDDVSANLGIFSTPRCPKQ